MSALGKVGTSGAASTNLGGRAPAVPPRVQADPMGALLFGARPPKLLDKRKHPKLRRTLRKLSALMDDVAQRMGQPEGAFSLELCEGSTACINREGQVCFGLGLLEEHPNDDDLWVGILGHELGHQPWTWPLAAELMGLSASELNQLHCEEEARADAFAGWVLAELDADPESLCRFLLKAEGFEKTPPKGYYPAEQRARMIRDAHARRRRALHARGPRSRALR